MRLAVVLALLSGCVELGVVTDGTSLSVGKPSRGHIVDGARLPDRGEGFLTREIWKSRGNRFGTDELVDLLTAVSRRVAPKNGGIRLVVADLSGKGGGAALQWHRSHQSGRDVDLLYYMRDKTGKPFENDAMHVVRGDLTTVDGMTVDIPRVWNLVRELLTAQEAPVQWVFMYQPIANALVEHAVKIGEPEALVERAKKACKQPGDSAPHHDHMHVRVYCAFADRSYGCLDIGPMELLAEREADFATQQAAIASAMEHRPVAPTFTEVAIQHMTPVTPPVSAPAASALPASDLRSIQRLLRTGAYRVDLWRWR
ncbi:MAG: penicillin-insensitive murein endopeptidase [Myxococcota bacterium]|nr:penicillin-insensitive murein endopeptidase [Myxococcota bacterium]